MNFVAAKFVCAQRENKGITIPKEALREIIRGSNNASWQPRCINSLLYLYLFLQIGTIVAKFGTVVANLHEFPKKRVSWQPICMFCCITKEGS